MHQGFYDAMQQASTVVTPVIAAAASAYPTYKVVMTGHSLGAAIAALFGTKLRNSGYTVDIVSYLESERAGLSFAYIP